MGAFKSLDSGFHEMPVVEGAGGERQDSLEILEYGGVPLHAGVDGATLVVE